MSEIVSRVSLTKIFLRFNLTTEKVGISRRLACFVNICSGVVASIFRESSVVDRVALTDQLTRHAWFTATVAILESASPALASVAQRLQ